MDRVEYSNKGGLVHFGREVVDELRASLHSDADAARVFSSALADCKGDSGRVASLLLLASRVSVSTGGKSPLLDDVVLRTFHRCYEASGSCDFDPLLLEWARTGVYRGMLKTRLPLTDEHAVCHVCMDRFDVAYDDDAGRWYMHEASHNPSDPSSLVHTSCIECIDSE